MIAEGSDNYIINATASSGVIFISSSCDIDKFEGGILWYKKQVEDLLRLQLNGWRKQD